MSLKSLPAALKTAALSLGLLLQAPAHAGLISGSWDPEFGDPLSGLSWAAYAEVLVPDNDCTNLAGAQSVTTGACAGAKLQAVFLRLYNTIDSATGLRRPPPDWSLPGTYFSSAPDVAAFSICDDELQYNPAYATRCPLSRNYVDSAFTFSLSELRIENGNVVGMRGSVIPWFTTAVDSNNNPINLPTSADRNLFSLEFTLNGPELWCETCTGGRVKSQTEGLRQFLVTYTSNDTSTPKFTDSTGKALGIVLDDKGQVLGRATSINAQFVPEPGGLALVLAALGAAALAGRRRGLPATAVRRHAP